MILFSVKKEIIGRFFTVRDDIIGRDLAESVALEDSIASCSPLETYRITISDNNGEYDFLEYDPETMGFTRHKPMPKILPPKKITPREKD